MRSRLLALTCVLVLGMALAAPTHAQTPNRRTFFTFSESVQLPGDLTLPAGKYVFRLANTFSDRYIVQVLNEDESKMFTTLFTMKVQRTQLPDEPEIAFMETPENMPPAVMIWWNVGESIGRQFIYPREQALRLVRATGTPVLASAETLTEQNFESAETEMITDDGTTASQSGMQSEPAASDTTASTSYSQSPAPAPAPTRASESVGTAGQVAANEPAPRRTLPQTASNMPFVGLLGLLTLAAALGLRAYSRARA